MHYMSRFSHPKFNLLPKMATHGPFLAVLTLLLMFLCVQCSVADGSTVPLTPNGEHVHAELQKGAKAPNFAEPLRNLKQGTLNFLHTTDTHGWYLGHVNQKQYSSDWGDFISFAERLRNGTAANGADLLLVDTGDRHDGNGLSDLTLPHGQVSEAIFMNADYDLITVGNHELYEATVSKYEYEKMVPYYGSKYISTNVEYLQDDGTWAIFGNSTHRYFQTQVNGYHILALSFMFDFRGGNERVKVTPISEMVRKQWLSDLLTFYSQNQRVDALVVFGHMPVSHQWTEVLVLHRYLRKFFPDTFIQYFGGHSHIRDYALYDERSSALQSGRYCETVGFLSLANFTGSEIADLQVHRRYIDFNLHSFMHHTGKKTLPSFETDLGIAVTKQIAKAANNMRLGDSWGFVPHNFYMSAANYYNEHDKKSLLRFLQDEVLIQLQPELCELKGHQPLYENSQNNSRSIIINSGSIRYDLYKGDFTRNALFTVSPFSNKWKVVPNVPREVAAQIQGILNAGDYIVTGASGDGKRLPDLLSPYQKAVNARAQSERMPLWGNTRDLQHVSRDQQVIGSPGSMRKPKGLSYGYVTRDDHGTNGDDTLHRELPDFHVPNVLASFEGGEKGNRTPYTDVVFYDFIQDHVLWALEVACGGNGQLYNELASAVVYYNDCSSKYNVGHLLKKYVLDHWPYKK